MTTLSRVARGGVLILGGGLAGRCVARHLGESGATIVNPTDCSLDADRRLVHVESEARQFAIAYADLVIAPGSSTRMPANRLVARLRLPTDAEGRVRVDETLRVWGVPHVWWLGDCARQARALARNLRGPLPVTPDAR